MSAHSVHVNTVANVYCAVNNVSACKCGGEGAMDNNCDKETGQCSCDFAFVGQECDRCLVGYYSYPDCSYCNCDTTGTENEICDSNSGQCICKENYMGARCDQCAAGYYSYPDCRGRILQLM